MEGNYYHSANEIKLKIKDANEKIKYLQKEILLAKDNIKFYKTHKEFWKNKLMEVESEKSN
jgi:hypothetical protein